MENKRIGIIGSGSWATAIAKIVTENGHQITWCLRQQSNIDYFEKRKHNPHYLRNAYFDLQKISFSTDIKLVVAASDIIIIAVPSIHIETTFASLEVGDLKDKLIVSAVKGVLPVHNILLNDWLAQKFNFPLSSYFTLLGPSHAEEVAAEQLYGDNFLSVFIANCANEMQVLLKEIAKKELNDASNMNHNASVYLGDLLVTCYSLHSRNRTFGNMIGKGYSVRSAELELNMVAEGYNASKCIHTMNQALKVELPIMDAVYQILWEGAAPDLTFKNLEQILV